MINADQLGRLGFGIGAGANHPGAITSLPAGWWVNFYFSGVVEVRDASRRLRALIKYIKKEWHVEIVPRLAILKYQPKGWQPCRAEYTVVAVEAHRPSRLLLRDEEIPFDVITGRREWVEGWLDSHYPQWRDPFAYWEEGSLVDASDERR